MKSLETRIPPPIVAALIAAAMWGVAPWGLQLPIPSALKYLIVAILLLSGLSFDLFGILAFRASRTTVNPLRPDTASALVTSGIYRLTRNPMYVGMACFLLAWATQLSALLPFLGVIAFILYMNRFQILPEERVLTGIFGEEYMDYSGRVRRWL